MTANQVVLITGAGRGIGRATADRFADLGATVIGTSRTEEGAARITDAPDGRRHGIRLDLTELGGDEEFAAAVGALTDRVDVLVVNAGVMVEADDITEQSPADFRTVLDVNLTGAFRTVRALLPLLRVAKVPRVITLHGGLGNVSSGMEGGGCVAYRVSKAGIAALTMTLAEEESESGLRACGFDPGWVATDLGGEDAPRKPAEAADELVTLAERMRSAELSGRLVRGAETVPGEPGMNFVADARAEVTAAAGGGDWKPLPGRDGISDVHAVGENVVKLSPMARFEAAMLGRTLEAVHGALAPHGLAPAVRLVCYDGKRLGTVFSRIDVRPASPSPEAVGDALARCHALLAGVPARWSTPWIGFYGEYQEFRAIVPAVEDDELRELGTALLPHARRPLDESTRHYVHRDLHPANVVAGPDGPCFVDWDLVHVGAPLDDLAMTALMWAAESPDGPRATVERMLAGYRAVDGRSPGPDSALMRQALAVAGLRQGIGAWFTDEGRCDAPYWPYIRRRIRAAAQLMEA